MFKNTFNSIALLHEDGLAISYSELYSKADNLYSYINSRSLVFCLCHNHIDSIIGYVSCVRNNVPALLLDANSTQETLQHLYNAYQPEWIWAPADSNLHLDFDAVFYINSYALYASRNKSTKRIHPNLAVLLSTSGSTGSPKFVRVSYSNLLSNATSIASYLDIQASDKPITSLPMHYSYGLSVINSHLLKGATLLLTNRSVLEKEFWTFFKSQQATSIAGVPYTYEILHKLRFMRMDLPSLKTITQAGGKLQKELVEQYASFAQSKNIRFFVMYGQTEATARMSYLPPDKAIEKSGSIGIAIPQGSFSLVDEEGNEITKNNTPGELVYSGPNVSMGYAESASDLYKEDENHGILYTGDIAQRDEDNFYYIVGRKKRFIKMYGNRVNLDETEHMIKQFTVADCACVGIDDHMIIYITVKDKEPVVKKYISEQTGIHHTAFDVRYIEELPKNSSGKILYAALNTTT